MGEKKKIIKPFKELAFSDLGHFEYVNSLIQRKKELHKPLKIMGAKYHCGGSDKYH